MHSGIALDFTERICLANPISSFPGGVKPFLSTVASGIGTAASAERFQEATVASGKRSSTGTLSAMPRRSLLWNGKVGLLSLSGSVR